MATHTRLAGLVVIVALLAPLPSHGQRVADEEALREAALSGDVEAVTKLLDRGVAVDAQDAIGSTALMLASFYGRTNAVKVLLARGADLAKRDSRGQTAPDRAMAGCQALSANVPDRTDPRRRECDELLKLLVNAALDYAERQLRPPVEAGSRPSQPQSSKIRLYHAMTGGFEIEEWYLINSLNLIIGTNVLQSLDQSLRTSGQQLGASLSPEPRASLWTFEKSSSTERERLARDTAAAWRAQMRTAIANDSAAISAYTLGEMTGQAITAACVIDTLIDDSSQDEAARQRAAVTISRALAQVRRALSAPGIDPPAGLKAELDTLEASLLSSAKAAAGFRLFRQGLSDWFGKLQGHLTSR